MGNEEIGSNAGRNKRNKINNEVIYSFTILDINHKVQVEYHLSLSIF